MITTEKMKRSTFSFLFLLLAIYSWAQVRLEPIYSDNMVLQQNSMCNIVGYAKPNKKILLTTSWDGSTHAEMTDESGMFCFYVNTPSAGGPYTLTFLDGKKKTTLSNVMVGEVWLCGGQSNMQMAMYSVNDAQKEIKDADNYPNIRLLHVNTAASAQPTSNLNVKNNGWEVCSSESVADFSATGYFFARELQKHKDVPVGIIMSCLGSTFAEPWISSSSLQQMPYFRKALDKVKVMPTDSLARERQYANDVREWTEQVEAMDGNSKDGRIIYDNDFSKPNKWLDIRFPGLFEDQLKEGYGAFDGIVWYRRTVNVPASWAGKECRICLGGIDDDDMTYVNGHLVGEHRGVAFNREYTIPAELMHGGKTEIAIRVHDTGGLGGFYSNDARIECGSEKVMITGDWKFLATIADKDLPFYPTNLNTDTNVPSALYNGMIAPLYGYAIGGALWYQGESSVGRAYQYRELLPLLINDWRRTFHDNFPFYIVQLANHMTPQSDPAEESTWAELREAQWKTSQMMDKCHMATIIDIGEADDIHPKNKQEVGRRLSLIARADKYDENVEFCGPQYAGYKQEGDHIRLFFTHCEGMKIGRGDSELKGFTIAGPDRQFHWATATIAPDGESIIVKSPDVLFPVAVRYGWANNPYCNLYNSSDLPASPFRTDEWPGLSIGNY